MSTTIDSLQIEIQSSSANAAAEIDALARSLGELKKNGKITTAVNNLNNLSTALKSFTTISSPAHKINALTSGLKALKAVGSVGKVAGSIQQLGTAMERVKGLDLGGIDTQFEKIANAANKFSGVKAGGLGTMVNALAKIGKVTESLDEETIGRFAKKVATLNDKLTPLSTKMTTIQAGLKGVNSAAKATSSSVGQLGSKVNATALNLSSLVTWIEGVVRALQPVINLISDCVEQALEWDGVAARFGRGFGSSAQETYDWIVRLNEEMGINIQQFMQYSSVYATMLTGFGVALEDAGKMALGYTELTYDIWAGYNDIYKNFDDAAEAVKSAIAGEVEPIRRAGFTIVESTLEQTAANYGLEVSLETATEAQKSYLRYLTLVDQAYAQNLVGTYASELATAEGLMRTFSQQTTSLAQAFGSLFLPILVKIMPYLQAFVELLNDAIAAVAAFFGITIQGVDWSNYGSDISSGLGGVTDSAEDATGALGSAAKAAEDLKKATLGIDELNVISPPEESGGSSGSSGGSSGTGWDGLDVDSLWDESIFKGISNQVAEIKEKLEGWLPVLEAVGITLGALGLGLLLEHMGTALSKMNLLNKMLASVAIATIEASLVFLFADNYLEEGSLLALVGEAVATAAGSYLLYKTWGDKGLVIGLGIAIAAQLAAITMNLADGGVEMTDPQLWVQSAFTTALAGAAGGWMAYKGLIKLANGQNLGVGKGVGIGLLVGLSLTLAAMTIGNVAVDGVDFADMMTGAFSSIIGGAAGAAIFTALGIASGGTGFLVGAGIMLAVNVIGAVVASIATQAEKSIKEDLAERFGQIELDTESIEFYVAKLTAVPRQVTINSRVWDEKLGQFAVQTMTVNVDVALDIFDEENAVLQTIRDRITSLEQELDAQNIKIALGMDVAFDDYAATIDNYVDTAQEYLDQYYLTANIALSITGADKDGSLATTLNTFYLENTAKLTDLGTRLKAAVSDAFVDGEWIPEKLEEARQIQAEIQEVLNYVSEVEYRAQMQNLKLEVSGEALTVESFTGVLEGATAAIEEKLASLEEVKMSQLKVAIMEYDANIAAGMSEREAKAIYDQTVSDIEEAYRNGKVEVQYGTVDFGLSTLQEAFADELEMAKAEGWIDFDYQLEDAIKIRPGIVFDDGDGDIYGNIELILGDIAANIDYDVGKLGDEVTGSMKQLYDAMKPTMADYETIANENTALGKSVPESVRKGLNDYNELGALAGEVDAINYMIGKGFSSDPVFLNTLATVQGAGSSINSSVAEGLRNNLQIVKDAAAGTVTFIADGVEVGTYNLTPTLVENMKTLGVDLSDGLLTGAESEMTKKKKSWLDWAIWPWNWFKEENEINSPSKLFERGGQYLVQGLVNGMTIDSLKNRLSSIWTTAKSWWNNSKGVLSTYTPSIGSISGKLSEAWDSAKSWWSKSKEKLADYTPNIGSISSKLSSAWTTAKNWWNSTRGALSAYTPEIGSISSKLSTAWSTAKTWWNNNKGNLATYTPSIGNIASKLSSAWTSAKNWWDKTKSALSTYTPSIGNIATNLYNRWKEALNWWNGSKANLSYTPSIGNIKTNLYNRWKEALNWWSTGKASLNYTPSIGDIKAKLSSAWNTAKTWWNNNVKLSVPSISLKVEYDYSVTGWRKAIVNALDLPGWPKLKFAAGGGIFDQGSLVWAGERGAEIVANAAGGKTGVMNVDQMQDAVYEGVYAAMVSAMRAVSGNNGQNVNVYLDSRQITASVEQRQHERGASIMGRQVYAY